MVINNTSAGNQGINLQILSKASGNTMDTGSVAVLGKQGNQLTLGTAHHVIDGNPNDCIVKATDNNGRTLWQGQAGKTVGDAKTDLAATTVQLPPEIAAKVNAEKLASAGDIKGGEQATLGTEGNFTGSRLNKKAQGIVTAGNGNTFSVDPQGGTNTGQGLSGGGVSVTGQDGKEKLAGIVSTQTTSSNDPTNQTGNINAVDLTKEDNRNTLASLVKQAGGTLAANDSNSGDYGSSCDTFGACPKTACNSCGSEFKSAA